MWIYRSLKLSQISSALQPAFQSIQVIIILLLLCVSGSLCGYIVVWNSFRFSRRFNLHSYLYGPAVYSPGPVHFPSLSSQTPHVVLYVVLSGAPSTLFQCTKTIQTRYLRLYACFCLFQRTNMSQLSTRIKRALMFNYHCQLHGRHGGTTRQCHTHTRLTDNTPASPTSPPCHTYSAASGPVSIEKGSTHQLPGCHRWISLSLSLSLSFSFR